MVGRGELAVLCVAVALRAAVPAAALLRARDAAVFRAPDTGTFIACADSLARGDGFRSDGAPEIRRTPGYPLLLVPGVLAGHVAAATIPLQIALGALSALLVCRLARALTGSPRAGVVAGLLCACEPLSVLYCALLLSETLFAAVLLASLLLLVRCLGAGRARDLAAAACGFAAAAYVRPIAYWLPLAVAAVLAARGRRWRAASCAFLAVSAALLGAWQVRNYRVAGYGGFSAIGDVNLLWYHGASVRAALDGRTFEEARRAMGYGDEEAYLRLRPEQRGMTPARRDRCMGREGMGLVRAHPLLFLKGYATGVFRTALGPGATDWLSILGLRDRPDGLHGSLGGGGWAAALRSLARRAPRVFWSALLLEAVLCLYLASAALCLRAPRGARAGKAAVALTAAYLLLMSGGMNGGSRFRHPIMPLVCVFAGCGLDAVLRPAGGRGGNFRGGGARTPARVVY